MKTITGFLLGVTTTLLVLVMGAAVGIIEELDKCPSGECAFLGDIVVIDKRKKRQYLENDQKHKDNPIGFRAP